MIEAYEAINKGLTTRFEMQISQGMRKRAGQTKTQWFLDAQRAFKADAHNLDAKESVHPALYSICLSELSADKKAQADTPKAAASVPPAKKRKA